MASRPHNVHRLERRLRRPSRVAAPGYTLIEMLVYVAVLAVIINLCVGAFVMCTRLSAVGTAALERSCATEEIRTAFTDAVRASSGVVLEAGGYRSGADCVVLEQPAEAADARRYVVFSKRGSGSRLSKLTLAESQGTQTVQAFQTFPAELDSLRIAYGPGNVADPENARLVTLEIALKNQGRKAEPANHRFSASPRGLRVAK